jgi:predicted nucleotidyltransferase
LRTAIAREAARVMLRESVSQYYDAKHIAAARVLGCPGSNHGPRQHLPSNGEIRDALLELVELSEGPDRSRRLFAMRCVALEVLDALQDFHARLIGSVATGHARRGSDIDVHVFTDAPSELERHLQLLGWTWESEVVDIRVNGDVRSFLHHHVAHTFPVELSVYALAERRVRQRSSTDGRAIDRLSPARLRQRLADEHPDAWSHHLATGELDLDGLFDDALPGDFDALLSEL